MKKSYVTIGGWFILFSVFFFWILFFRKFHGLWSVVNILYSLMMASVGIGIIFLRSWARKLLLLIAVIKILEFLIRLPFNVAIHHKPIITIIVDGLSILVIGGFVFWFFNKESIKKLFS